MREIKFRAWDKKEKKMHYDAQNTYDFMINNGGCFEESFKDVLEYDNYVVMQYTNCYDINGKEIYEGDIVKVIDLAPLDASYGKQYIGKIIYDKDRFKIDYKDTCPCDTRIYTDFPYWIKIEVIGNMYENKNLLEVK